MGVTCQREETQVFHCQINLIALHRPVAQKPSQNLQHFDIEQVGRVTVPPKYKLSNFGRQRRRTKHLDHRRGIDDDHAESRSFRTAEAADIFDLLGFKAANFSSISS